MLLEVEIPRLQPWGTVNGQAITKSGLTPFHEGIDRHGNKTASFLRGGHSEVARISIDAHHHTIRASVAVESEPLGA